MKYIVFPKSDLDIIPQEVLDELHLTPRISVDGLSVIMKTTNYNLLFPSIMTLSETEDEDNETIQYPYPTYEGELLNELLNSSVWNADPVIEEVKEVGPLLINE